MDSTLIINGRWSLGFALILSTKRISRLPFRFHSFSYTVLQHILVYALGDPNTSNTSNFISFFLLPFFYSLHLFDVSISCLPFNSFVFFHSFSFSLSFSYSLPFSLSLSLSLSPRSEMIETSMYVYNMFDKGVCVHSIFRRVWYRFGWYGTAWSRHTFRKG